MMSRPLVAALASALLASACAGILPTREASPVERDAYRSAMAELPASPEKATPALEAFVAQYPRSPLADDALEALAGIDLAAGDTDAAALRLRLLLQRYDGSDRSAAARVALAELERERGNAEEGRRLLGRLRFGDLNELEARRAYRLGADLAPTDVDRVRWLAALRDRSEPALVPSIDDEIDRALQNLGRDELDQVLRALGGRVPSGRVLLSMAERALDGGDTAAAANAVERAELLDLREQDRGRIAALREQIERRERLGGRGSLPTYAELAGLAPPRLDGAAGTIGVVLPLSGPFASYGEASLQGILLAAGVFGADEGKQMRVVVRDSRGQGALAARAVHELADRGDVVAIVGPLTGDESQAAADAADEARIPLLALTSRENVAAGHRYVLRLRATPRDEVEPLVEYATQNLGARRFAVLYPDDAFGRGMRRHFWDVVREHGGDVVAVGSYSPDATDFAGPIRNMIGYSLLTPAEQQALRERDEAIRRARRVSPEEAAQVRDELLARPGPEGEALPPIVDFDALFVPDTHDRIVMIAPQLSFHDIRGVRLLGTSGWNHPDLLRIGRGHVRGAVISALFHEQSRVTFVADFVERYTRTFGERPDAFSAAAFDAANLVLLQLVTSGNTRDAVARGLHAVEAYPGASGIITILPDGNARKRPFLLGVRGREIVSLD